MTFVPRDLGLGEVEMGNVINERTTAFPCRPRRRQDSTISSHVVQIEFRADNLFRNGKLSFVPDSFNCSIYCKVGGEGEGVD